MIGIFDSGSGGLTVLREIRARMPMVDILYFGDIKNAPYGGRSQEKLSRLTIDAIRFLQSRGVTSLVSACNSVSASLAVSLFDTLALAPAQLIEMVGPTVTYCKDFSGKTLLVATPATIRSGIYQNGFRMLGVEVMALAIPELAGAIEFDAPESEIESSIRTALANAPRHFDRVILACTHYPLVRETFERVLVDGVEVVDPALAVAERVERQFGPREAGEGRLHFVISQDSSAFRARVAKLFDVPNTIEVLE